MTSYVYASKLDFRFVAPAANLVGTMYRGSFRLGSFFNGENSSHGTNGQVTVESLIKIATSVESSQPGFSLQSAMVNDELHAIYGASRHNTQTSGSSIDENFQFFASEIVNYVVLQSPVISITTGNLMDFSLIGEATNNVAVYPSPNNLLLYRAFNPIWAGKQDSLLEGISYHGPTVSSLRPPVNDIQLKVFLRELPRSVVDIGTNAGDGVASNVAKINLLDTQYIHKVFLRVALSRKEDYEDFLDTIEEDRKYEEERVTFIDPMTAVAIGAQGLKILQMTKPIWKPVVDKVVAKVARKAPKAAAAVKKAVKIAKTLKSFATMSKSELLNMARSGSQNQQRKARKILSNM